MSKKSSNSSQIISLPKGGGALQGIGEKFSPDLHTGTGNFTVPIALPTGRNGFQPQLNLVYSTGNGNSPFGLGWSLSIPGVSRKTSKGVPRYDDSKDVFILSGAEDLVPVEKFIEEDLTKVHHRTRYRPRTEGLFARIDYYHDADNNYWEIRSKDGLVSFYGTERPADADSNWQDPAVVADPSDRMKVFAWKLTQTLDPFGNRIEYEYERDLIKDGHNGNGNNSSENGPHHWDQIYLKQIRYADYTEGGETKFLVSVSFVYEDRPDPFSEYRPGFEIRTRRRCTKIEIRTHADEERLVRTYHLVYLDQKTGMEHLLPLNGVSLLSQIEVVGHDGDETEKLPPLEFGYTRFEPERRDFFPLKGRDLPARSLANPDQELVDLFGNGLPDILEMNGTVRYWRNLGYGQFDLPREMRDAPAGLTLAEPDVQLIDADGDGRTDLLVTKNGLSGYFPLRFGGLWDRRSFQRYRMAPSFNLEDPEVRLVDLDGDGVTDAIRSGTRLECFFNDPKKGWNDTRWVERRALEEFPNINFSDPHVKWADMTGDGLQDIVLVYDGNVEYWPNLGYGNWAKQIHMRNSPRFPYGYDPKRILVGDVDGDGLADIVYVDHCKVILWINQSGNGWSNPIEIDGTPSVSDMDAIRLTDMLGTGISGVLWSMDANGLSRAHMFFLDFTGGLKPYVMDEMDNHMGSLTRVAYTPSTRFYLEDQKRPETRWKTPLPFPVQVVARVEVIDAISRGKLATEYRYHHGYWDGAEREFRGFGMVEQLDTETFENYNTPGLHGEVTPFQKVEDQKRFSPPTLTKTWFHQGPIGDEFGDWEEVNYSHEFWSGDPPMLERPASMINFLKTLPRRVKRDALRALRGSILRTELYALDGTERQDRPYTVTENLYGVREEAPPSPAEADRLHIFFPHTLAQRTTQWERSDDPMTSFSFTDDYDEYGQPRKQTQIACPRGWHKLEDIPGQPYLATQSRAVYVQRDDSQVYIVDRVAKTTSYEIKNDGSQSIFDLKAVHDNSTALKVIGQTLNVYDGDAFTGLPFGQIGDYGALVRTESLVLMEGILHEAFKSGDTLLNPPEVPPYLLPDGPPAWTVEYPQAFRDQLPPLAGYIFYPGDAEHERGYFVNMVRRRFDFHEPASKGRGLLKTTRDPLGGNTGERDTVIEYDKFGLLPTQVTDPAGLTTQASYDYRVLQPKEMIDLNGNHSAFTFTPLGLLESTAVMGKENEAVGDSLDVPGVHLEYDLLAFANHEQPVSVRTIRSVHHVNDIDIPLPERDEAIKTIEYSDGFGRLLQARTQAEDITFGDPVFGDSGLPADQSAPTPDVIGQARCPDGQANVVVSGWQVYDNKGRVVEQYEPFFSCGWDYAPPTESQFGQKVTMFYDPRGQVIRTVNPDGSEQRVIYGVPVDLSNPDQFAPMPWEAYTYDTNDNAGRTHPETATSYQHHWNTPANIVVDALGRTIESIERNGANRATDWYTTRSTYDIRGNLLTVTDALGRVAFRYVYDLANRPLRIESIDAGVDRRVLDALGNAIEGRDRKSALVLSAYDILNRPIRLWARDDASSNVTLRERLEYGDGGDVNQLESEREASRMANRLGELHRHYDEAGSLTFEAYDFKGNVLQKVRYVIGDSAILSVFSAAPANWQVQAFRVDWQPPGEITLENHASRLLDPSKYRTSLTYDALNRVKTMHYPEDVDGGRKELHSYYNHAGMLERVEFDGAPYVEHVAYNAKGQWTLVAYGNGVMTRYAYDPQTFHLLRLRTEHYTKPNAFVFHPTGVVVQDFAYEYDLAGNMLALHDRTPNSGLLVQPNQLDRLFTYDPLYRLISSTGREHATTPPDLPWVDVVKSQDPTLTRAYTEHYQYDPVGNIAQMQHQTNGGSFTRQFVLESGNNRLDTVTIGQTDFDYSYDANGNMIRETTSRHFEWDHSDRMKVFRTQTEGSEPSVYAHYLYDAGGQRVKKLVRKENGTKVEAVVSIEGLFEYHRVVQGGSVSENNTLHIMDDEMRIATVRIGFAFADDSTPTVKYHLGDHLDSSQVVLDGNGGWVNREEYTPYGETSFGSFARKRYRFTGKEQDEESGLYYHGARYYAPWLGRWISCDPEGIQEGLNLYGYVGDNPIQYTDPSGLSPRIIRKTAERALKKIAKGGKGVAGHGAKRHGSGGIGGYMKLRHLNRRENLEVRKRILDEYRKKSVLKKGDQADKLSARTLKKFDPEHTFVEGKRVVYQRAFGREIGREGETLFRVVVDIRTAKVVTYLPQHVFKDLAAGGAAALLTLESGIAKAAARGEKDRAEFYKQYQKSTAEEITDWVNPIMELSEGQDLVFEPNPDRVNNLADRLIKRLEKRLEQTFSQEERDEIRKAVWRAYTGEFEEDLELRLESPIDPEELRQEDLRRESERLRHGPEAGGQGSRPY